jgi:hypothetical protein
MFHKTISATALALAIAMPAVAAPTLIGDTVTANYLYPDAATTYATSTFVVGAGPEVSCAGGLSGAGICQGFSAATSIDIEASSIVLNFGPQGFLVSTFNGVEFAGLDFGAGYVLAGFNLTTDLLGLDTGDISFTNNSIAFNAQGLGVTLPFSPFAIRLDLVTRATNAVPEPGSFALLGLGLAGLGVIRKRKQA